RVEFNYDNNTDYFRLQAPTDGVMSVTIQAENASPSTGTMTLYLRDQITNVIETWTVNVGANGAPVSNTFVHRCTGTEQVYYLEADDPNVCGVSYRFSYSVTPPAFADDLEPNQSSTQATNATAGLDYNGRVDFNYDNDFDYFRLQAPTDGVLNVTIQAENASASAGTMTLYLRDAPTNIIETWTVNVGANGVPVSNTFMHRCTGTEQVYYMEADDPNVCGVSYRFSYTVTPPAFADDLEPNQTSTQAISATAGTNYDGRIDFNYDNNFDYFRLQAATDGVLNVTIQAESASASAGTMTLYLRDAPTNIIETWTVNIGANGTSVPQTFSHTCTGTEQVFFLEAYNPSICGVSYRFIYTVTPPLFTDDPEPNQTSTQAISAMAGTNYEGRIDFNYDNDFDYFRLQAPTDGVLNVTMEAEHGGPAGGTMTLYLRDAPTNIIETWTVNIGANGVPDIQTFSHRCTGTEQVYYLEVDDPNVCGVSYRFSYTVTPPVFADDLEPNQTSTQAISATAGTNYDGRVEFNYDNNFDYFRLQAPTDGVLNVTIQAENAGPGTGTMTLYLRDQPTNVIETWTVNIGANGVPVSNTFSHLCTGTEQVYYLEPDDPNVCGVSYRFSYTVTPPAFADDLEPNQTSTQAISIDLNATPADGRVEFEYDNNFDYFRINHAGGPIVLHTRAEAAGTAGTMQILIRDAITNVLQTAIIPVGGNSVPVANTYTSPSYAAGVYYIEPFNPTSCGTSYRFDCYDDDGDGTCNAFDLCAGGPEPGAPCNDNNGATINDVVLGNCICQGTLLGADCNGVPGGPALPGTACSDNNVCTVNDVFDANCLCAGTFADADGDGTCDASDLCPGGPEPGTACNDNNGTTINDMIQANCLCAGTLPGNDCEGVPGGPAVPGSACDDNNVCTTGDVYGVNCLCAGTFADADGDGTCNANDVCPGGPEPGTPCNDNSACTTNDVIQANCTCAGTPVDPNDNNVCTLDGCDAINGVTNIFQDADVDGTCDANDLCPGGPEPGTPCNDNNVCTTNDVIGTNCQCAGTFADTDADGTCDANDLCPGGPEPGTACNDNNSATINDIIQENCLCAGTLLGNDCNGVPGGPAVPGTSCNDNNVCTTGDVFDANCLCVGTFADADEDGTCDADDVCLAGPEPGTPCNDGNGNTINDVIGTNCLCSGVNQACSNTLTIEFQLDANPGQVTWEIREQGTNDLVQNGGGLVAANSIQTVSTCVPNGCYYLKVMDSVGNGMGGYILRTFPGNVRIIDNRNNFTSGGVSQIAGNEGFCLPLGPNLTQAIYTSCDKLDWVTGEYFVVHPNANVSAGWTAGTGANEAKYGYETWIYNPNGGYSFRRYRSHDVSDGFGPDDPDRACHMKINNWAAANQIPTNVLMNVRIRTRINNVNSNWGPACRFMINPAQAACPLTKLMDIPGNANLSCGASRKWGNGNYVYARPVSGATQYQFRFRIDAEGFL
ncbi:MAG: hypothetical protein ABI432_15015, partial [Flavobacteriales bacterium]